MNRNFKFRDIIIEPKKQISLFNFLKLQNYFIESRLKIYEIKYSNLSNTKNIKDLEKEFNSIVKSFNLLKDVKMYKYAKDRIISHSFLRSNLLFFCLDLNLTTCLLLSFLWLYLRHIMVYNNGTFPNFIENLKKFDKKINDGSIDSYVLDNLELDDT